jgi:hypothetical protein
MPSWNVHTAHVERLLHDVPADKLGIQDVNAFLFGNYVPDVYVGYMVPDVSFHLDYCMTHVAAVDLIPVPDADLFWDSYIAVRLPDDPVGVSLVLGAWAHLQADRCYNGAFRRFRRQRGIPVDDSLRQRKQGDFDLFGRSLPISALVREDEALVQAAARFVPYRLAADDVRRSIDVANSIVEGNRVPPSGRNYQLLDAAWMDAVFERCNARLALWLQARKSLIEQGKPVQAAAIRAAIAPSEG